MAQPYPSLHRGNTSSTIIAAIVGGVLLVTLLHYLTSANLLPYHAVYRNLYYLPITVAAVRFGIRGGLLTSAVCILLYLPHAVGMGEMLPGGMFENLIELPLFVFVAVVVGVLADRERKQREQLRRMDRLAAVGQLAAGIAHEVRNPLAVVRATAQLLATHLRERQDLHRYATVLTDESDRIERLVGGLLEYAKPRQPVFESLALADILTTAVQSVEAYALEQQVIVQIEPASAGTLFGDAQKIQQLLLNLLLNAIQASSSGGRVWLKSSREEGHIMLRVIDEGRGMEPEELERACDPFFTTRTDGTGLGLAMVAAIIAEHVGKLQIASTRGHGTTITVMFPERPITSRRG